MSRSILILRLLATLVAPVAVAAAFTATASATLGPGDILVVDADVPPVSTAVLFQVDPVSGARTVVAGFGAGNPTAVAVEVDGSVLVTDNAAGTDPSGGTSGWGVLYRLRLDAATGTYDRTILTDFGVGASTGRNPLAVAVEPDGNILVIAGSGGSTGIPVTNRALLVRVDPLTGARAVVSDFGNPGQGGLGVEPRGVAVEAGGHVFVIDAQAGFGGAGSGQGELVRIDPLTGMRASVSNFGTGANPGSNPTSLALEGNGQVLVTDEGHPSTAPLGLLFRVDSPTGIRNILSDFNVGPNLGREPEGVALEHDGGILVVDKHAGALNRGMLFRVDPQSGARTIVSDFGAGANQGGDPLALAVVPPIPAKLLVITEVVNDDGGALGPHDFLLAIDRGDGNPDVRPGEGPPGDAVTLDPGGYSVLFRPQDGYVPHFAGDCLGAIAAGETRSCTVTFDDLPAWLTVIVEVVNDDGGTAVASDWTIAVTGTDATPSSFAGAAAPGTTVTLDAGPYGVFLARGGPSGYTTAFGAGCTGTIALVENRICRITHDDESRADTVAPEVSCTPPANGAWSAGNVTVACTASDAGSGLANAAADASFSLSTSVPAGSEDPDAATGTHDVCDRAGNCRAVGPYGGYKVDRKAPTLSLPADLVADATSSAGAAVSYGVSAVDGADPSPTVSCVPASGSVFAIATTGVECVATDHVGNASSGRFTVTLLGAREQLAGLVHEVIAASSPAAVTTQLLVRIEPLLAAFDPSDPVQRRLACAGLNAFSVVVRLFAGRGIPAAPAAAWLADANRIRAVLGC